MLHNFGMLLHKSFSVEKQKESVEKRLNLHHFIPDMFVPIIIEKIVSSFLLCMRPALCGGTEMEVDRDVIRDIWRETGEMSSERKAPKKT